PRQDDTEAHAALREEGDPHRHSTLLSDQAAEEEGEATEGERLQGRVAGFRTEDGEDIPSGRPPADPEPAGSIPGCRGYPGRGLHLSRRVDGPRRRGGLVLPVLGRLLPR